MVQKTQDVGVGGSSRSIGYYTVTNNVYAYQGVVNCFYYYHWIHRVWQTTTNWKAVLASQGYLATQPYTDDRHRMKAVYVSWTNYRLKSNPRNGWAFAGRAGALRHSNLGTPTDRPSVIDDAKSKCLARARDMSVNLAVSVAEGRKTVDMLLDTCKTLGKAYGHFRRGRFKQAAKDLGIDKPSKSAANNWLAYQYGWKPLVSDAVGLADTLRKQYSNPRPDFVRVTSTKREVITGKFDVKNHTVTNNHGRLYFTDVVEARAGLLLEITNRGDQFRASVGLNLGDIALTAWERVPFSFVFDWFVDVGGYLDNISALSGMTVKVGWVSYIRQRTGAFEPSGDPTSLYTSDAPPSLMTRRLYTRSSWTGSAPTPRFNGLDGLGLNRLITSAALFKQIYRHDKPIGSMRPSPAPGE